ncbi:hypothetical protein APHAL10511_007787 [Amanita phalloides]|nr:hypothetical protein APHAL10511_007787 [Amanita phalloides]
MSSNTGVLILSSSDIDQITSTFSPTELMDLMAKTFLLSSLSGSGDGRVPNACTPHRTSIPSKNHTVLFMPARISTSYESMPEGMTVKVVSVPLAREGSESKGAETIRTRGLPATTLVLDEDTGSVKAVLNARSLTALRTGAGANYILPSVFNNNEKQAHSCLQLLLGLKIRLQSRHLGQESKFKHTCSSISNTTLPSGNAQSSIDLPLLSTYKTYGICLNHGLLLFNSITWRTRRHRHRLKMTTT